MGQFMDEYMEVTFHDQYIGKKVVARLSKETAERDSEWTIVTPLSQERKDFWLNQLVFWQSLNSPPGYFPYPENRILATVMRYADTWRLEMTQTADTIQRPPTDPRKLY